MAEMILPNPMGSMFSGLQAGNAMTQIRNQNKLAELGPGLMNGDQNALNAWATIDPMAALQFQQNRETMDMRRQEFDQSQKRFEFELENARRKMTADEKAAEAERLRQGVFMASTAETPEQWDAMMNEFGLPELVGQFDMRDAYMRRYMTAAEILAADAGPTPLSTPGKVQADINAGILPPDYNTSGGSEAEQEIARLTSVGVPRDVAIKIKEGVLKADRHPLTGELQVVDLSTGELVWKAGGNPNAPAAPPADSSPAPVRPDLTFGERFGDAPNAFGVEGAIRNVVNQSADALGFDPVWPETMQTQRDFDVFREALLSQVAEAYSRQPPSWLMKEIRDLTPAAGNPFEGAGQAKSKLTALRRSLLQEWSTASDALQNRALSPETREQLETKEINLRKTLLNLEDAIDKIGGNGGGNTTSSGVQWRIVD